MFKFFKSLSIAFLFFTLAIVSFAFAQDTTQTGVLESAFFEQFAKSPAFKDLAVYLYPLLIGLIFRVIQLGLKKMPTSWGPNGPNAVWTFAALLFGKSILFYNAKPISTIDSTQKMLAEQKLLDDLQTHIEKHRVKPE